MIEREEFLKVIRKNIDKFEYHVSLITYDTIPRYAYTIGCSETVGLELILAGGEIYSKHAVSDIIKACFEALKENKQWRDLEVNVGNLGTFTLKATDDSWTRKLALGIYDVYSGLDIPILQIIPDAAHRTLEVPDLSLPYKEDSEPIWQWLTREWKYPIPRKSMAVIDINVLFGKPITEVMRWEDGEWEIFTQPGEDVLKSDMRMIPLGIILGIDSTIEFAVTLELGRGAWRDPAVGTWNDLGTGAIPDDE